MQAKYILPRINLQSNPPIPAEVGSGKLVIIRHPSGEEAVHVSCNGSFMPLVPPPISWEGVRVQAAIEAMQGLNSNRIGLSLKEITELAVAQADALIAELQKEVQA
jgi:hypothetical protein